MKIFLRILAYSGVGLMDVAVFIAEGWAMGCVGIGISLIVVALIEMVIKYGNL